MFRPLDLIEEKKEGREHSPDSLRAFAEAIAAEKVPDYQITAWLMAVRLRGMSDRETAVWTSAMAAGGKPFRWKGATRSIDKHSTAESATGFPSRLRLWWARRPSGPDDVGARPGPYGRNAR